MKRKTIFESIVLLAFLTSCNSLPQNESSTASSDSSPVLVSEETSMESDDSVASDLLVPITGERIPNVSLQIQDSILNCEFTDTSSQIDDQGFSSSDIYSKSLEYYEDGVISTVSEQLTDSNGVTYSETKESVFAIDSGYYSVKETDQEKTVRSIDPDTYAKNSSAFYNNSFYLYQGQVNFVYSLKDYKDNTFSGFYFQSEYCYATKQSFGITGDLFVYHYEGVNSNHSMMTYDLMFSFVNLGDQKFLSYYYVKESFTGDKWISDSRSTESFFSFGTREKGEYPSVGDTTTPV